MNKEERMRIIEERILRKIERDGIVYKKVAPGEGKVIIKENGVIIGEIGDLYPTEKVLESLIKETEEVLAYEEIKLTSEVIVSAENHIIDRSYTLNNQNISFENFMENFEITNVETKKTLQVGTHLMTNSYGSESFNEYSSQLLLEAS